MSQYGVFDNPIPQARRTFPFVAILQSELANTGTVGRLTPVMKVANVEHVLLVPPVGARSRCPSPNLSAY